MTSVVSLGSYNLPDPDNDGQKLAWEQTESNERGLQSAGYLLDVRASKARISLAWTFVTETELSTLLAAWLAALTANKTLTLSDARTYTVTAALGSFRYSYRWPDATTELYAVTMDVVEV